MFIFMNKWHVICMESIINLYNLLQKLIKIFSCSLTSTGKVRRVKNFCLQYKKAGLWALGIVPLVNIYIFLKTLLFFHFNVNFIEEMSKHRLLPPFIKISHMSILKICKLTDNVMVLGQGEHCIYFHSQYTCMLHSYITQVPSFFQGRWNIML